MSYAQEAERFRDNCWTTMTDDAVEKLAEVMGKSGMAFESLRLMTMAVAVEDCHRGTQALANLQARIRAATVDRMKAARPEAAPNPADSDPWWCPDTGRSLTREQWAERYDRLAAELPKMAGVCKRRAARLRGEEVTPDANVADLKALVSRVVPLDALGSTTEIKPTRDSSEVSEPAESILDGWGVM